VTSDKRNAMNRQSD